MNWTGGALPRSRNGNAKTALTATQKKHFAKVRGKLLNGSRSSPDLDFSIFDHAGGQEGVPPKNSHSSLVGRRSKNGSQTQLENYRNTALVARRLSSIKPRPVPSKAGSFAPAGYRHHHAHDISSQSMPLAASRLAVSSDQLVVRPEKERTREPQVSTKKTITGDSFESRRQDLLRRQDWVGLANSKPAKIDFTDPRDRHLIGKRRQLEDKDQHSHQPKRLKRHVMQHYGEETSSIGDISVKIGHTKHAGYRHEKSLTPPYREDSVTGMVEEMLFDDDQISAQPMLNKDMDNGRSHQNAHDSPSISMQRPPTEIGEDSESLHTSWAGFSPGSNSTHLMTDGRLAGESSEVGGYEALLTQRGSRNADAEQELKQNAWIEVPGLPLIFGDDSQKPIEISSDSASDSNSVSCSSSQKVVEENRPASDELTNSPAQGLFEDCIDVIAPKIADEPMLTTDNVGFRDTSLDSGEKEAKQLVPGDDDAKPQPRTISAQMQASTSSIIANASELPEALPAVSEAPKQPASPAKELSPPNKEAAEEPSLVDEELIWRRFVFGDEAESLDDNEPKKPAKLHRLDSSDSRLLTDPSESPGRSSLSAQASSGSVAARAHRPDSTNLDYDSGEAAADLSLASSDRCFPSAQVEVSLPATDEPSQKHLQSSIVAHASTSSSPSRPHQMAASPSSDELAMTPRQPTFYFKKPSRYIGAQHEVPKTVHLGQKPRMKGGRKAKNSTVQQESGQSTATLEEQGVQYEDEDEDEILDA